MVSLRLSCAVKPPAAHAATPSDPLPSGSDCEAALFGWPRKTSERDTTPPVFSENAPFCQAVVLAAADAAGARPRTAVTRTAATAITQAAALARNLGRGADRADMSPPRTRGGRVLSG